MNIVKLDLFDGRQMEVVVTDEAAAGRLRRFNIRAGEAFADAKRWEKIRGLMTHEHSGPNVGWTIGILLPGDDPDQAIDDARRAE